MKRFVPSKTFLVGEYAVLQNGAALLLTTPPCFSFDSKTNVFIDPHEGRGGFGASSAQFVLAEQAKGVQDPWEIWQRYRESGLSGSGADVIAQCIGGIVFFDPAQKKLEKLSWPFQELSVALIHTGNKLPTHEHLENLTAMDFSGLDEIVLSTYEAMRIKNQLGFLKTINDYAEKLLAMGLVAKHTEILLKKCRERDEVLACKGCGAMGSDVVLLIIPTIKKEVFTAWANEEKLNLVFCGNRFYE